MSRKLLYRFLACLLCLLPALTHAQTLAKYEYWFDDNFSGRHGVSLSGTEAVVKKSISTDGLDYGAHKFSFRVRQSDGKYSAITSSMFLKRPAAQSSIMEYWFDDNFDGRDVMSISSSEEEQAFELDLRDNAKYPWGFHKLNMRVTLEGGGESAVYSSGVLKLSAGTATTLEYWLDDDRENIRTLDGHLASDGQDYLFVSDLDLGAVTPGHHRLYCRVRSNSGKTASAVTMTPIIVKSRYNVSSAETKVTQYSLSIDNETPVVAKLGNPGNDITFERDLDVHDLAPGTHTLKAKFYNSIGAGVGEQAQFTVTVPETPAINLTATEQNGMVQLHFDVPTTVHRYAVARRDANGAKAVIYKESENEAGGGSFADTPPAGNYTYFVQGGYHDTAGNSHLLNSNEVPVQVAEVMEGSVTYGHIYGWLTLRPGAVSSGNYIRFITYSDGGEESTTTDTYFKRENIPVGTSLTISARGMSNEDFEPVTITIKPGDNYVHLVDKNRNYVYESTPNNYDNDLQFSSDLEWVGNNYQFKVKNITRNTWNGQVRLRIISKDKALREKLKEEEEGNGGIVPDPTTQVGTGSVAPIYLRAEDNYVYVYSDDITLSADQSAMVSLSLDNVFAPDKNDWYYIYVESVGKWTYYPQDAVKVKPVGIDYDFSVTENPILRQVNKDLLAKAWDKLLRQDAEYAANFIYACCTRLDQLNGFIGNLGDEGWVKLTKMYKEKYPLDLMDLNQYLDEAIETESAADYEENLMLQSFLSEVCGTFGIGELGLANAFRDNIANDIFKYTKGVSDYLGKALKYLKYFKAYRTWDQMNEYEKFFNAADAILDFANQYTETPICAMLKTYTKVGRSLIQKALEYGEKYYENYAPSLLKMNATSEYKYNYNIDFKIMVRKGYKVNIPGFGYFNFEKNGTSPIREVVVKVHNHPSSRDATATLLFDLVPVSDGVMLKQTSLLGYDNLEEGYPIDHMWMEIKWKNGRITKIPLREDIDGVEFGSSPHNGTAKLYTVYLRSETTTFENMADELEIGK